jgi:hypothetical protein
MWFLTLNAELKSQDFANKVLRKTFGPRRVGVNGKFMILHERLCDLFGSHSTGLDVCPATRGHMSRPTDKTKYLASFTLFTSNRLHISLLGVTLFNFFIGSVHFGHSLFWEIVELYIWPCL